MKKLFFLALSTIFLCACTNDNTNSQPALSGEVNLNFDVDFKNQDLVMYDQTYGYEAGMALRFQLFQFYISNVYLIKEMQDTLNGGTKLVDIQLISYKDVQTSQAAQEGISLSVKDIPSGSYKGIRLGIGVADEYNLTQPGDHPAGHPLSDNYWTAAKGYIFTKIEGNADLAGTGNFEQKLTFHIGASELYKEKVFFKDVEVPSSGELNMNFTLDVNDILVTTDDFLDFRVVNKDHTTNMEVATFIADNLANAIRLNLE